MDHVTLHTITLCFSDGEHSSHQVTGFGMDPVFAEAQSHVKRCDNRDHVTLDYLAVHN